MFVTGANGFIGRNTIAYLKEKEFDILAPDSKQLNLLNHESVKDFIEEHKPNYLLHFAWEVTPGKYLHNLNNYDWLKASENLLYYFKKNNGQRVVVAGTCFEYFYDYPYPASKKALLEVLKNMGISYAWGRIYYLFGEDEYSERLVPYLINSFIEEKEVKCSSGEQVRDYMHVKDVARAFVEILDSNAQGIIDIGTGDGIKVKDIINLIAEKLNGQNLVKLGALNRTENEIESIVANISKLTNEIGFIPQYTIEEGLEKVIEYGKMMYKMGEALNESKN